MSSYRGQAEKTAIDRALQRFVSSRPGAFLFVTIVPAIDKRLMALSKGRIRMTGSTPSLLVHARGAKSGEPRVTPLTYTPRDDAFVLVASKGGAPRNPAWYHNLKAHPDVEVEVDGRRIPVHAREATGDEYSELWALVNDNYSGYETYQGRTGGRVIPVMVLEPR